MGSGVSNNSSNEELRTNDEVRKESQKKAGDSAVSLSQVKADLPEKKPANQKEKQQLYQISEQEERTFQLQEEIRYLKQRNEELLSRLSAMASTKLTDGNANIADLSDQNRPTKLAEQFSELYDNEWTEAFDFLTKSENDQKQGVGKKTNEDASAEFDKCSTKHTEVEACTILHQAVCRKESTKEALKLLKEARKKHYIDYMSILKEKKVEQVLRKLIPKEEERKAPELLTFFAKSMHLCWLMTIQDPPVYMDQTTVSNQDVDKKCNSSTHKAYTKSGPFIDFIVWPTIYLYEGGSILCKGVAQYRDKREPTAQQSEVIFYLSSLTQRQEQEILSDSKEEIKGPTTSKADKHHEHKPKKNKEAIKAETNKTNTANVKYKTMRKQPAAKSDSGPPRKNNPNKARVHNTSSKRTDPMKVQKKNKK